MRLRLEPKAKFVRANERALSLWQSAASKVVKQELHVKSMSKVLQHPMMLAVNNHVALRKKVDFDNIAPDLQDDDTRRTYESYLLFQACSAKTRGDQARAARFEQRFEDAYRPYSDKDPNWEECAKVYLQYYYETDDTMSYNDWTVAGNNKLDYGVIDFQLPNDGTVAIIGDWGTGMDDAIALLEDIINNHSPSAIIHLGDIYYSGTPDECVDNFSGVFDALFEAGNRIPVFTLPGNHDYYDWGVGFYEMLPLLNSDSAQQQKASYFCLRTADNCWQFLGMDTGFYDSNPADYEDPHATGPWLHATEVQWHLDKITKFGGSTILLSHHQLFTANSAINGELTLYNSVPYLNPYLYQVFWNALQSNVAMWMWGHEHNFVLYQSGLFGLAAGRLVGCSAYEEIQYATDNSYFQAYPEVPYQFEAPSAQLTTNTDSDGQTYYNHGYAIVDLQRSNPTDPISVTYYQFPSWDGDNAPASPASWAFCGETIACPTPPTQTALTNHAQIELLGQEGFYVSAITQGDLDGEYYPTLSPVAPVSLVISSCNDNAGFSDGDSVMIATTDTSVGDYTYLGAFDTSSCYYYTASGNNTRWTINKCDTSQTTTINTYDNVYFTQGDVSQGDAYVLTSSPSAASSYIYMTTADASTTSYNWRVMPATASSTS